MWTALEYCHGNVQSLMESMSPLQDFSGASDAFAEAEE